MINLLLTSSNYNLCMGTSSVIQLLYMYGVYRTGIYFYWNISGIVLFTLIEYVYHRYILHYTNDGNLYYYLHGKHHLKPFSKSLHVPILYLIMLNGICYYLLSCISHSIAVNTMITVQFSYIIFELLYSCCIEKYIFKVFSTSISVTNVNSFHVLMF
jgi:hypothetical protein